jgi:hypothetical protein
MAQVVEQLLSKSETLSSNPTTTTKKKKKKAINLDTVGLEYQSG